MSTREAYRIFCRDLPDLPVFLEPWYLEAAQDSEQWDAVLVWDREQVIAALPYFIKTKAFFTSIVLPPFVKFLGPVLRPGYRQLKDQHRLYAELIRQLPKVASFKQNFHPDVQNWLPFYWAGFQQSVNYTYRLGLKDLGQVFSGIAGNKRREIAKAAKTLVLVHELPLEDFYRINKMSFDRQNLAIPYSLEQLARHDEALSKHQARKLFFAVDAQQQIHSAAYLIWDKQRAYFHLAGDDPAYRKSFGGFWLIWKCIEYTRNDLGLMEFDFEGSMLPEVEAVRRRFGAYQVPYFRIWKYNSRLYKWLDGIRPSAVGSK